MEIFIGIVAAIKCTWFDVSSLSTIYFTFLNCNTLNVKRILLPDFVDSHEYNLYTLYSFAVTSGTILLLVLINSSKQ